jgi:hypothetical protein
VAVRLQLQVRARLHRLRRLRVRPQHQGGARQALLRVLRPADRPTAGEGPNLQVTPITLDRSWSRSYSFGTATGAKKYAQLLLQVTWSSVKVTVDGKFCSWDTKRFSTNDAHLESSTGTGR